MVQDIDLGEMLIDVMTGNSGDTRVRIEGPYGVRLNADVNMEAAAVALIYAARAQIGEGFGQWFAEKREKVIRDQLSSAFRRI